MCAEGNIHYELNTVARDLSFGLSSNPDLCSYGRYGIDKKLGSRTWPYDESLQGEKPYDALRVSGAGRGTGRADFLPNA